MNALSAIHRSHVTLKRFKSKTGLTTSSTVESETTFQRLPASVVPSHYTMCIKPNLSLFSFEGCVAIRLQIKKDVKTITMNAADLNISKIMWEEDVTENRQEPMEYFLDNERERLRIVFEPSLAQSKGVLRVNFNGELRDKLVGFYRTRTVGIDGEEKYNAVTRFEPTDARRCFPCWDEPALKATFDLSFIVPRNLTAISNMPIKVTYPHRSKSELHVIEFDTTPAMSTYLVAFAIGTFDFLETKTPNGTQCRVYTPLGKSNQGEFALSLCARLLTFYETYFGLSFTLPKLDMVAVADSSSSATENWGLITYREYQLLVEKPEELSVPVRTQIFLSIANSFVHQWFGCLASLDWWTQLWLTEGYATYLEFQTIDYLEPEQDIWTEFVTNVYVQGLNMDALKTSHPIEVPVSHPSEIKEAFDRISYYKGAALIRMLQKFVGEENFKKGVNAFLKEFQFRNGTSEDLWLALEEATSKPVVSIMSSWTKQLGFPLVRIVSSRYELNQRTVVLSQEKFWADPLARDNSKQGNTQSLWVIPITIAVASHPTKVIKEIIMDKRTMNISIPNVTRQQWFKLNPGTVGFFRVKYTSEMLGQFLASIRTRQMNPLDRMGLLGDLLACASAGLGSTVEVLSLLEAFVDEDNYIVWTQIDAVFAALDTLLNTTEFYEKFKYFGRSIYNNIYEKLGWVTNSTEKYVQTKLRSLILSRMLLFDHEKCLQEALARFDTIEDGSVPNEFRTIAYKAGISIGTSDTLRTLFRYYRDADNQEEKERILNSLGHIKEEDPLNDVLDFATTEVGQEDSVIIIKSVCSTPRGKVVAWEFFKENFTFFRSRYTSGKQAAELVETMTLGFSTEDKAIEIAEYFRDHVLPGTERAVQEALEKIHITTAWLKRDSALISDYLMSYE